MTWPPPELRPGWDYELYNDALIERLEAHDWWKAYTAARDSARAKQTELPHYPTVEVLEVQKALNEVATEAMLAQHLARVRLVAKDREEAATGVGKRSAAGQSEVDPDAEEEVDDYSPVDPDYLISAFAEIFAEVWGPIRDTLVALRGNEALAAAVLAMERMPDGEEGSAAERAKIVARAKLAARARDVAAATLPGFCAEEAGLAPATVDAEAAVRAYEVERRQNKWVDESDAIDTLISKLEYGFNDHTGKKRIRMGIEEMKEQLAEYEKTWNSRAKALRTKQSVLAMYDQRLRLEKEYRESGRRQENALGGAVDYGPLWLENDADGTPKSAYQHAKIPDAQRTRARYVVYLAREEKAVAEAEGTYERAKKRFDKTSELLATAKRLRKDLKLAEKNEIGFGNVGRYLLNAFPLDSAMAGGTVGTKEKRDRWAALLRVFHEPVPCFARGRAGVGEPPAFVMATVPRGFSFFEDVASQPFDVVALPHEDNVDKIRVVGRRWCMDPGFVRELIRLSIDVAGLPAGTLKVAVKDDDSLRRTLVVGSSSRGRAEAVESFQVQAFGVAVEVAARKVRGLLGKRKIAAAPQGGRPVVPAGFELYDLRAFYLIGWDVRLDGGAKRNRDLTDAQNAYAADVHARLLGALQRMGAPSGGAGAFVGGLRDEQARAIAATLAAGGYSRQIAVVIAGCACDAGEDDDAARGGYGLAGKKQCDDFIEFDVLGKIDVSGAALAEVLRMDDASQPLFRHLSPNVLRLSDNSWDLYELTEFLSDGHSVALALYHERYHVLFKDRRRQEPDARGGTLVLIDPMDAASNARQRKKFEEATERAAQLIENGSKALASLATNKLEAAREGADEFAEGVGRAERAAAEAKADHALNKGLSWTPMVLDSYRNAGQEGDGNLPIALARALALALGVRRAVEGGQPDAPLLGATDDAEYDATLDMASAVSDLAHGLGPLCLTLAALAHNADSVPEQAARTRRDELWG